jgi:hypothetical protein
MMSARLAHFVRALCPRVSRWCGIGPEIERAASLAAP